MARRTDWGRYGLAPLTEAEAKRMRERNRPGVSSDPRVRQFRDTQTGEILSRRQAENRRVAIDTGWDSWSQWQRTTSPTARETQTTRRWQHFADSAVQAGKYKSRAEARKPDSDLNIAYNEWRKTGFERGSRTDPSDPRNRANTPYARYLVASGMRSANAKYPVGETPKRKRGMRRARG